MADTLSASDIAQIKTVIENALAKATLQGDRAGRAAETERARQMAHALVKEGANLTVPQAFDELFKRLADNPVHPPQEGELPTRITIDMLDAGQGLDRAGTYPVYNTPEAIAELERRIREDADREVPRPSILRAEASASDDMLEGKLPIPAVEPLPEPKPEKHARKK